MSFDSDTVAYAVGKIGTVAGGCYYVACGDVDGCGCVVWNDVGEGGTLGGEDEGPDVEFMLDVCGGGHGGGGARFGEEGWEECAADVGGVAVEMGAEKIQHVT